jgi:hypothetical protein
MTSAWLPSAFGLLVCRAKIGLKNEPRKQWQVTGQPALNLVYENRVIQTTHMILDQYIMVPLVLFLDEDVF